MNYKKLNNTNLSVSPICIGTVHYGTKTSKQEAKAQISKFVSEGGNFIDTAHVYGDWVAGPKSISERIIGEWIAENGNREQLILSTKGAHPYLSQMAVPRVNAVEIHKDVEESLTYLQTEYIDLYFLHRDDPQIPVAEIMESLDNLQKAGKIRYYGCSNWTIERIKEAQNYCKKHHLQGFSCNQIMWSLADINFYNVADKTLVAMDTATYKYHVESEMSVMAYMSVAKGYFPRKAKGGELLQSMVDIYENASNERIFAYAKEIVAGGTYSYIDLFYLYLMAEKQFPAIPIASFSSMEQLGEGLACWEKEIPYDICEQFAQMKEYCF